MAAATAAVFLLAALSWLFLILSLILFAVNEWRSVCSFRRVAAASFASCAKTMEPAAHQAGINLELPFIATDLDYGHPRISDTPQNCRSTLVSVNRATIALNIPFPVTSGPAKPPHQQYELGHLITKEREFHLQRMTQKRPFASLVERS